jgi:hypothetical protein
VFYRLYLLDSHAKIFHGEDIDALNNDAAVAAGRALFGERNSDGPGAASGFEIWRGRRLIFRVGPGETI